MLLDENLEVVKMLKQASQIRDAFGMYKFRYDKADEIPLDTQLHTQNLSNISKRKERGHRWKMERNWRWRSRAQ